MNKVLMHGHSFFRLKVLLHVAKERCVWRESIAL